MKTNNLSKLLRVATVLLAVLTLSATTLHAQYTQSELDSIYEKNAALAASMPEPDRSADDFVLVSLCVADPTTWRDDILGVMGHAFLRLQCPYYGLDYCFSYEGERVNDNLFRYLSGDTKMGMFAVPTDEYLEDYRRWNRSVHEYFLDLPADAETRLWEIMDNHLTKGTTLRQNLSLYGCAITIVRYVKRSLGGDYQIQYAPSPYLEEHTPREIGYATLSHSPWLRLVIMLLANDYYDRDCPLDEKLIVPADLVKVWEQATVDGRTLATYKGDIVEGAALDLKAPWFTPMLLAVLLLLVTLAFAFTRISYWDRCMLALQAQVGLLLIVLCILTKACPLHLCLLLVLLNPLPAVFWHWRRYWAWAYAAILLVGVITLACMKHQIIDPAFLVLALAYVVLFAKDKVKTYVTRLAKNR